MDGVKVKVMLHDLNTLLNKNYDLISFDSLSPQSLLQILSDTLGEIDNKNKIDIKQEEFEDTIIRILEMLRIFNYKLSPDLNPSTFRQGLVQGDKRIIYPLLEYLLSNIEELKKRSYLAQYLVKINIPPEFKTDPDIEYLYEQYEAHIEDFKMAHKESEELKEKSMQLVELKSDIAAMESERDIVINKINKLKKNAIDPNLLDACRILRLERDRRRELSEQEDKLKFNLAQNEQKLQRLQMQLREMKKHTGRTSSTEILRLLQEDCEVNGYLAKQKIPQEIKSRQEEIQLYEDVINQSHLSRAHLDDLNFKIQQANMEINEIMEKQLTNQNNYEDRNSVFRQQATIISRKKESKAEQLQELRHQFEIIEDELEQKRRHLRDIAGDASILRGDEFKKFVAKLRNRSAVYKKLKAHLASLKTESGILARTIDVLVSYDPTASQIVDGEEIALKDNIIPENNVSPKHYSSERLKKLNKELQTKKSSLEPLINELRPLREQFREILDTHEGKKRTYDATVSGLENAMVNLEKEVDVLEKDVEYTTKEINDLENANVKAEEDIRRVADEKKIYVSGSGSAKKDSLREQLLQKISEQDKAGRILKDEQDLMKDKLIKSAQQLRFWKDLEMLMECKINCFESEQNVGIVKRDKRTETLILPN